MQNFELGVLTLKDLNDLPDQIFTALTGFGREEQDFLVFGRRRQRGLDVL